MAKVGLKLSNIQHCTVSFNTSCNGDKMLTLLNSDKYLMYFMNWGVLWLVLSHGQGDSQNQKINFCKHIYNLLEGLFYKVNSHSESRRYWKSIQIQHTVFLGSVALPTESTTTNELTIKLKALKKSQFLSYNSQFQGYGSSSQNGEKSPVPMHLRGFFSGQGSELGYFFGLLKFQIFLWDAWNSWYFLGDER